MKYRASKLIVKHVDAKTERDFLNNNHKQGAIPSTVAIGLFDGDELVQIETFGQPRIEIQNKSIQHQWELLRECSKKDCQVHGGKSRLLKHFIEEYKPVSILSYCSLTEGFDGHSYAACGFTKLSESGSYHYEYQGQKIQRYRMQKNSKLRAQGLKEPIEKLLNSFGKEYDPNLTEYENAVKAGFVRVNDPGNQVWEMKFAKYIGYIYEFELEGKKYRGKHILTSSRPYYGSGTAWRTHCRSIPGYKRKINIKILEWLSDDDIETLDSKLTEVETRYIREILGREDYLNISDNTRVPNYANCHNPISNANRAKTIANRTLEQKEISRQKRQETISNRTPEQKTEFYQRRNWTLNNRTPERKAEVKYNMSEAQKNRSPEQKVESLRKYRETMNSKTSSEKVEAQRQRVLTKANRTPEQKEVSRKKCQETWLNRSPERKVEFSKKMSEIRLNETPEARAERLRKYRETMNSKTPGQKAEISKRRSEAQKNMTTEQKAERLRKYRKTQSLNFDKHQKEKLDFLTSYFDRVENIDQPRVKCFKGDKSISILVNGRSLEKIKEYIEIKGF